MRGTRGARRGDPSMDEVEEMLRAAEDDLLLNLTANSHSTARRLESPAFPTSFLLSSSSLPSPLDADLAARFDALKLPAAPSRAKQPKSTLVPSVPAPPPTVTPKDRVTAVEGGSGGGGVVDEWSSILGDDLSARFAALKGASSAANISSNAEPAIDQKPMARERRKEDSCDCSGDVLENEVEKLLQWAMDAARLEPSSSVKAGDDGDSSEDDHNKEEEDEAKDSDDEDDATDENGKRPTDRKTQPNGNKPKKWFLF